MSITKSLNLFLSALILFLNAAAQDKWDLRRCVEYGLRHNTSIKQADIDSRTFKLTYDAAKGTQFGTANFSTGMGVNFGHSINQSTNVYSSIQGLSQIYSLQAVITVFNWFALRRATET